MRSFGQEAFFCLLLVSLSHQATQVIVQQQQQQLQPQPPLPPPGGPPVALGAPTPVSWPRWAWNGVSGAASGAASVVGSGAGMVATGAGKVASGVGGVVTGVRTLYSSGWCAQHPDPTLPPVQLQQPADQSAQNWKDKLGTYLNPCFWNFVEKQLKPILTSAVKSAIDAQLVNVGMTNLLGKGQIARVYASTLANMRGPPVGTPAFLAATWEEQIGVVGVLMRAALDPADARDPGFLAQLAVLIQTIRDTAVRTGVQSAITGIKTYFRVGSAVRQITLAPSVAEVQECPAPSFQGKRTISLQVFPYIPLVSDKLFRSMAADLSRTLNDQLSIDLRALFAQIPQLTSGAFQDKFRAFIKALFNLPDGDGGAGGFFRSMATSALSGKRQTTQMSLQNVEGTTIAGVYQVVTKSVHELFGLTPAVNLLQQA